MSKEKQGHVLALITILIWGTTFISTKILLRDFEPVAILFIRFIIGYVALLVIYPKRFRNKDLKLEALLAGAGLCGITLYYLLENISLTYTLVANVGVIVSIAPFFTAILAHLFLTGEKLKGNFFLGFLFAIIGISLISYEGTTLKLNPLGDLLAFLAAIVWAFYSIITKKISSYSYPTIQTTRRIFGYGLIFMLPSMLFFDVGFGLSSLLKPVNFINILYLGIGASAMCFVTWNIAVKHLGATRTSVYIYLIPVITIVSSALILHEKVSLPAIAGTALTIFGLLVSEDRIKLLRKRTI
jgi:drug/metabolite transporter (DMT)-like permease